MQPVGSEGLPPEFRYCLQVIQDNLHQLEQRKRVGVDHTVYHTDRIQIFCPPISLTDIPSENHWKWNQTKSRFEVVLAGFNRPASLVKLTARKRGTSSLPVPSLKLWLCTIPSCDQLEEAITVTWCEKGLLVPGSPPGTVPPPQSSPRIEDYDFLAHLMPEALARSLWPSRFTGERG